MLPHKIYGWKYIVARLNEKNIFHINPARFQYITKLSNKLGRDQRRIFSQVVISGILQYIFFYTF